MAYGAAEFLRDIPVSRETLARLQAYVDLLLRWNRRINLIARSSEADIWQRHILDSAQLAAFIPPGARTVADLGAGAGLPGLILSIVNSGLDVALVEADARKCAFLREAVRVTQSPAIVHESRIEAARIAPADVVVARALAPLDSLLELAQNLITVHSTCLFLKGSRVEAELTEAKEHWNMQVRQVPSRSDPSGRILIVSEVVRARR